MTVLLGLFRHTRILEFLGVTEQIKDVQTETRNGLYDFTIQLSSGSKLNIELKVDQALTHGQIKRQVEGLDGEVLWYLLLGNTRFDWPERRLRRVVKHDLQNPAGEEILRRVGLDHLLQAVEGVCLAAMTDSELHELSLSYATLLRSIGSRTEGFRTMPLDAWGNPEWRGFYAELDSRLELIGEQGLVNQPNGNQFVGFWWAWTPISRSVNAEAYLQLELNTLCFKVSVPNKEERTMVRNMFSDAVLAVAKKNGVQIERPRRFGSGAYMVCAKLAGDYRCRDGSGIDWDFCKQTIQEAATVFEAAVRTFG